jgi:hypothetical protein
MDELIIAPFLKKERGFLLQSSIPGGVFCRSVYLICLHESEDLLGIKPFSRANQVAAFDRISRTIRSCRFSRRSLTSPLRSSLVNPSLHLPSSRSVCATQLWIDCAVGSNSLDNASGAFSAHTNSTMRRRNSGRYCGWTLA